MTGMTLDDFVKISSNLNCRDKSVKILQYGSRLIIGYYSNILQKESIQTLSSVLASCSLGRRSFRLFKSVNNIQLLILKLNKLSKRNFYISVCDRVYVLQCIEAFEQLCWALFFLNDNIILGIKMGILNLNVTRFEGLCFPCWFAADFAMFSKTLISLHANYQTKRTTKNILGAMNRLNNGIDGVNGVGVTGGKNRFLSIKEECVPSSISDHNNNDNNDNNNDNGKGEGKNECSEESNGDINSNVDDESKTEEVKNNETSVCEEMIKIKTTTIIHLHDNGNDDSHSGNTEQNNNSVTEISSVRIKNNHNNNEKTNGLINGSNGSATHINGNGLNGSAIHGNGSDFPEMSGEGKTNNEGSTSPTSDGVIRKNSLNITDFQNTTIKRILSNGDFININKILETERTSEKNGLSPVVTEKKVVDQKVVENDAKKTANGSINGNVSNGHKRGNKKVGKNGKDKDAGVSGVVPPVTVTVGAALNSADNARNDSNACNDSPATACEDINNVDYNIASTENEDQDDNKKDSNHANSIDTTTNDSSNDSGNDINSTECVASTTAPSTIGSEEHSSAPSEERSSEHCMVEKLRALEKEEQQLIFKLVKSVIDLGVSGSFNPRLPFKRVLGEGGLGALGVISAAMAIYEEVKK